MVFNVAMNEARKVIDGLGGPAKVAELLGYDKHRGGVQRVHNWRTRGIPSKVLLEHPQVFGESGLNRKATPSVAREVMPFSSGSTNSAG